MATTIMNIPNECFDVVASYIDSLSLIKLGLSCKTFYLKLNTNDKLWINTFERMSKEKFNSDDKTPYYRFRDVRNSIIDCINLTLFHKNPRTRSLSEYYGLTQVQDYYYIIDYLIVSFNMLKNLQLNVSQSYESDKIKAAYQRYEDSIVSAQFYTQLNEQQKKIIITLYPQLITNYKTKYLSYIMYHPTQKPSFFHNSDPTLNILHIIALTKTDTINLNNVKDTIIDIGYQIWKQLYEKLHIKTIGNTAYPITDIMPLYIIDRQKIIQCYNKLEVIQIVLQVMFEYGQFRGSSNYYDPMNSYIDHVCETKQGIPISLCAIASSLAHYIGLTEVGLVGLPGHVMLGIQISQSSSATSASSSFSTTSATTKTTSGYCSSSSNSDNDNNIIQSSSSNRSHYPEICSYNLEDIFTDKLSHNNIHMDSTDINSLHNTNITIDYLDQHYCYFDVFAQDIHPKTCTIAIQSLLMTSFHEIQLMTICSRFMDWREIGIRSINNILNPYSFMSSTISIETLSQLRDLIQSINK